MERTQDRQLQNRGALGIILMIAGLALYPLSDAFIKHLSGIYSLNQTIFLRSLTRFIPLFCLTFFQGGPLSILKTRRPLRHIVRLAVNFGYTYSFIYAVKNNTLTSIYTLAYTSPFFMIILSAIILKEKITRDKWLAVFIGMIGVIVATRPGSEVFEWVSLIIIGGTFLGALNKILMRKLSETEHSLMIAMLPNMMFMLVLAPMLSWQSMPLEHWALFAFVGLLTACAQYAIALAVRFAKGSTLAPIDYSNYFWVVSLDYLWWNKIPMLHVVLGAAIIVGSNLFILYRSRRDEAAEAVV